MASTMSCDESGLARCKIAASVTIEPGCIVVENGLGGMDYGIGGMTATVGGGSCGGWAHGERLGSEESNSHVGCDSTFIVDACVHVGRVSCGSHGSNTV